MKTKRAVSRSAFALLALVGGLFTASPAAAATYGYPWGSRSFAAGEWWCDATLPDIVYNQAKAVRRVCQATAHFQGPWVGYTCGNQFTAAGVWVPVGSPCAQNAHSGRQVVNGLACYFGRC